MPKNEVVSSSVSKKDTVITRNEQLADEVDFISDYQRTEPPKKMTYLTKNAVVTYQDMKISADYISIDWETGKVFARGKQDENGRIIEPVITDQGGKKYETDYFDFNFKSKQAIAYNARTEESEGVIVAEKTKKVNDSVYYMRRGKYTTDEYFIKKKDTIADYYLLAPNIKLIKGKNKSQVITGPVQMYIERVPTPLALPFGILPFSDKRSAGILIPSFGETQDVGFFLNGLGYYQPIGEHFDVKVLVDIFTKGSWNIRPEVNYKKNYRYSGNFSSEVGTTVRGIKGLDDYSKSSTYRIGWRHQQDPKANPFFNFAASVDITSNKFYNNTINNNHIFNQNVLKTQQSSTISATKRFLTLPITITGAASYSQNFADGTVNLRLPQMNVAVNQFYLFKPKNGATREGLLENITVNTGLNFSNYVSNVKQEDMFKPVMWEKLQTALQNNISISTNTTLAKYFIFSVSANIDNGATTKTLTRAYNPVDNTIENVYNRGVSAYSTFSASASLQTTLYGMLNFKKGALVERVRHMVIPSIGFSYQPDFGTPNWGYYRSYYASDGLLTPYSVFDGTFAIPMGPTAALNYNISNNIEMKVRSKSDSTGIKKVKLFESLNISGGYNFVAASHKIYPININGQTSFLDGKVSLNSSLVIDPYKTVYDELGVGTRTENFGGFNLQGFNVQLAVPLSDALFNKEKKKPEEIYDTRGEIRNENYFFDEFNYAHFNQPWTLNLNANYAYTKGNTLFGQKVASVGIDGSVKLTPFWNINGSTHYDFITKKLAYTRLGFHRDQRSFIIDFNWVPFGQYKTYDFYIGIKANILRDAIKYKDRSFTDPGSKF